MADSLSRPALILIDGHALAYRTFHALPIDRFTTQQGEPTNATFGFARTLLDLLDMNPDYIAVSFDQGHSGRDVLYPEYKGTRDKMSDLLSPQIDRIRELVQAFNIPILEHADSEADDVIGTTTRQAEAMGVYVYILTGDHDLLQLVDDHAWVWLPATKTQTGLQLYDRARVIAEKGVSPEQIPDYKGLFGDSSDNIPGVYGVGEKTAAALLQQYGTLSAIYDHLDEQKPKLHEKLETGRENAFLSKNLATIRTSLPITLALEKCVAHDYDSRIVASLFKTLEFRSLLTRLPAPTSPPPAGSSLTASHDSDTAAHGSTGSESGAATNGHPAPILTDDEQPADQVVQTVIVDTPEALAALVADLEQAAMIAFDTETTGFQSWRDKLVGISLSTDGTRAYYIPVGHVPVEGLFATPIRQLPLKEVIAAISPAMSDPNKPKIGHNASFDLLFLGQNGLDVTPIGFDPMIAEWVINPDSHTKGLKDLAAIRLKIQMTEITSLIGRGKGQITFDRVPIDRAAPYAAADAAMTYRLVAPLKAELESLGVWKLYAEIEVPLIPVLASMERIGARIDIPYLQHLSQEFRERQAELQKQIIDLAGYSFNLNSLKQLNEVLFDKLGLPTTGLDKTQHGFSLDAATLEGMADLHPIVRLLLDWRGLEKLRSTYIDALPELADSDSRVHTDYNQTGANTGRLSSESPNLQNIPIRSEEGRRVRRGFIAQPGWQLLSVDYSQIELRILAHYSHDPFMIDAFDAGQDIHTATASAVFGVPYDQVTKDQRYLAKRVNFGLMYGMGAYRLGREANLSMSQATEFIERYFARLPDIQRYLQESKDKAAQQGYLETMFGRRRYFKMLQRTGNERASAVVRARMEREAINMPVQGTNADIIKRAMVRLPGELKLAGYQARLILQVHDELVLEVPDSEVVPVAALVQHVMESSATLDVPLKTEAKVGHNWIDMQSVEDWEKSASTVS